MSETLDQQPPEIGPELELELRARINEWLPELAEILPEVTLDAKITFDNKWLISDTGTGGFALEPKHVALAFNPGFVGDKNEQMRNFKGSLFHEFYHQVQEFVGNDEDLHDITALENAIYEGAATKFEVIRVGTNPGWSQYPEDAEDWVREIATLGNLFDIGKWKFYDPQTNRRWIMYRSGCYIVDQAMLKSGKSIEELAKTPPMDIFKMSEIELH
jgi:uncharacterized protein YjaZ